ncbi:MAG: carbamoyl-phosphate synthase large subunit, partial [Actinobacteria bacterium]|nr:carbamoyl-phosphate synthase large subunit [Actinomycetota bacterium]
RERPDAVLPTMGGQTALNLAMGLASSGLLAELGIELIGADVDVIARAEDRELFKQAVESCGLEMAHSRIVTSLEDIEGFSVPAVVRPAFTLGGHGGGFVASQSDLARQVALGLAESPIGQVLVEESLRGWDEFELEVVRDRADNVVIVCSIENLDPMGVHTGDSVTVAPQMTLSDEAYQELRDAAIAIIRAVGVDTGGSNIQFARHRDTGRLRVVEMNPRVSRSSALASKATGYPIAKVAAKLAVGYTLDEIPNDLTGTTPASFEPTLDYVVVKMPRFAFEKFPGADQRLGTQMKSVGESMGIGRTFVEAFAKARRGLDCEQHWHPENLHPWFADELERAAPAGDVAFRRVDSCAGEVEARSNYFYSTRGEADEEPPAPGRSVVILGSGPNRIGQGIEFDYCCVHAAQSFHAQGYEAVMVNCNPETVSTDYDTSDRLYFEPLTLEDVLGVIEVERPLGVLVQFGGQTPLKLAHGLQAAGVPLLGTPVDSIDLAEDRARFGRLLGELGLAGPPYATADSPAEALKVAAGVGYPLLVRPSYVLGGRAMEICYSRDALADYLRRTNGPAGAPNGRTIYLDRFLENAIEIDVDALCDGERVAIGGIMQHVEEAGVHSGDSACVLPAMSLGEEMLASIEDATERLALRLGVVGLINVQYAIGGEDNLYVIEANPRASRTVPFVSKAVGIPLAKLACRIVLGERIGGMEGELPAGRPGGGHVSVKEAVLPFGRFPRADSLLGPEMRSTGEVMGIARDYPTAFGKAQSAAGARLPTAGTVFISVTDGDKPAATQLAASLHDIGFRILATGGTAQAIRRMGVPVERIRKLSEGSPNVVERIEGGHVDMVINTPTGSGARADGYEIRRAAVGQGIPCITTMTGASAAQRAIRAARESAPEVRSLQELHAGAPAAGSGAPAGAEPAARP